MVISADWDLGFRTAVARFSLQMAIRNWQSEILRHALTGVLLWQARLTQGSSSCEFDRDEQTVATRPTDINLVRDAAHRSPKNQNCETRNRKCPCTAELFRSTEQNFREATT